MQIGGVKQSRFQVFLSDARYCQLFALGHLLCAQKKFCVLTIAQNFYAMLEWDRVPSALEPMIWVFVSKNWD